MSIRVMTWVWENANASGTDLLVLLAIADNANDDGTDSWPSEATLADKTRVSTRTVRRCIRTLEENGALVVEQHKGGFPDTRPDRRPNRYTILMTGGQDVRADTERADIQRTNGRTSAVERADTGVRITVQEPSIDPSSPAREVVNRYWEESDPKPATPYIALVKNVERLLGAGWLPEEVSAALPQARAFTVSALEYVLRSATTGPKSVGDRNLVTLYGGNR